MGGRGRGRSAVHVGLLATLALVLGGCFASDTRSVVAADGAAVTRIVVEIDVEAYEKLLAQVTEDFGDVFADLGGDGGGPEADSGPGFTEEIELDIARLEADLADLYDDEPGLRERFGIDADLDGGILRTEIRARTEEVEHLGLLLDGILGSGTLDYEELFGFPGDRLGTAASDIGGGTGVFATVTSRFEQGRFVFGAQPPASGGFDDDIEVEFARFDDLRPEITITLAAPGDVIETNGRRDGRVVTWELDGTETDALALVTEIDPDAQIGAGGFDALPSPVGSSTGFPTTTLAVVAVVLSVVGGGVYFLLRRTDEHERGHEPPDTTETSS